MKIIYKQKMKDLTSFKVGGEVDVIVEPRNIAELVAVVKFLRESNYIYYILGNGTNVLVSDKGVRGCIIHLGQNLSNVKVIGNKIETEPGALLSEIAKLALNRKLKGMEELSGIPGSIGGAVCMNAGAYNKEIKDIIHSVNVINEEGKEVTLGKDSLEFAYRYSNISEKGYIVTKAVLQLQEGDKNEIKEKMENYHTLRCAKQPLEYPSAGSTFKRPEGGYASLLIQDSNLKGESVGGAMVSEKHAGFIINTGKATAQDIYKLMCKVQESVKTYFNVLLEPEIRLWGKF